MLVQLAVHGRASVTNKANDDEFDLDTDAFAALAAAQEVASSLADDQCGTEHLLFGVMLTASGEVTELRDLFALDPQRIERAIKRLAEHRFVLATEEGSIRPFSARSLRALSTPRADGTRPAGVFELLHGMLQDDSSGACQVLRALGVRTEELRRLAAYGTRHLSDDQVANLMEALDRRTTAEFRPWWGPRPAAPIETMAFGDVEGTMEVARSESARASIRTLAVTNQGFGLTLTVESITPWLLPPVLQPSEVLVPGSFPAHVAGPELLELELAFDDGRSVSNRLATRRWDDGAPDGPQLTYLGHRAEVVTFNDRRRTEKRTVTADWWVWPLPIEGPVEVRVTWPAESLRGAASFDSNPLIQAARSLSAEAT